MTYNFPMTRSLTETSIQRANRIKAQQMSLEDAKAAGIAFTAVVGLMSLIFGIAALASD